MIHHSDALTWLRTQPDCSFDAMLTDPPAGIGFMTGNKGWDSDRGGRDAWVAWLTEIMREAWRVLKPGAHALVWSIPQTSHWTGWALESAGFEVRNCVYHLVGNRMPKNHAIGKNIDKRAGKVRETIRPITSPAGNGNGTNALGGGWQETPMVTAPATPDAAAWEGHGTSLRSLVEPWWLVRKPLDGTIVNTALTWGTGGINVDGCRIGTGDDCARKPSLAPSMFGQGLLGTGGRGHDAGRWPANCILSDDAARDLDAAVGERPSTLTGRADPSGRHDNPGDNGGASSFGGGNSGVYADDGGPSRYFYTSKVSSFERSFGCSERSGHPCVKPISLTEYLARLLLVPARSTPRRIVVPFAGVGSEMIGAIRAGWEDVEGVEMDATYVDAARARIARWREVPDDMSADDVRAKAEGVDPRQTTLFGGAR